MIVYWTTDLIFTCMYIYGYSVITLRHSFEEVEVYFGRLSAYKDGLIWVETCLPEQKICHSFY